MICRACGEELLCTNELVPDNLSGVTYKPSPSIMVTQRASRCTGEQNHVCFNPVCRVGYVTRQDDQNYQYTLSFHDWREDIQVLTGKNAGKPYTRINDLHLRDGGAIQVLLEVEGESIQLTEEKLRLYLTFS